MGLSTQGQTLYIKLHTRTIASHAAQYANSSVENQFLRKWTFYALCRVNTLQETIGEVRSIVQMRLGFDFCVAKLR